jgi:hypothetical protein
MNKTTSATTNGINPASNAVVAVESRILWFTPIPWVEWLEVKQLGATGSETSIVHAAYWRKSLFEHNP